MADYYPTGRTRTVSATGEISLNFEYVITGSGGFFVKSGDVQWAYLDLGWFVKAYTRGEGDTLILGIEYGGNLANGHVDISSIPSTTAADNAIFEAYEFEGANYSQVLVLEEVVEITSGRIYERTLPGSGFFATCAGVLMHSQSTAGVLITPGSNDGSDSLYTLIPASVRAQVRNDVYITINTDGFNTLEHVPYNGSVSASAIIGFGSESSFLNPSLPPQSTSRGTVSWGAVSAGSVLEADQTIIQFVGVRYSIGGTTATPIFLSSDGSLHIQTVTISGKVDGTRFGQAETDAYNLAVGFSVYPPNDPQFNTTTAPLLSGNFPSDFTRNTNGFSRITGVINDTVVGITQTASDVNGWLCYIISDGNGVGSTPFLCRLPLPVSRWQLRQSEQSFLFASGAWVIEPAGGASAPLDKWYASRNTSGSTVGLSGTALSLVASNQGAGNFFWRSAGKPICYRYGRIRFRSVGKANVAVQFILVGGLNREWTFSLNTGAAGAWVEYEIDFRKFYGSTRPNGVGGTFPNVPGFISIQNINIQFPTSTTIEIEWIRLNRRDDAPRLSVVGLSTPGNLLSLHAFCDGFWVLNLQNNLKAVHDFVTTNPESGWALDAIESQFSASEAVSSLYIFGGGGRFVSEVEDSAALEPGAMFDLDSETAEMFAVPVSRLSWFYPGCGDITVAGNGEYGSTVILRFVGALGICAAAIFIAPLPDEGANSGSGTLQLLDRDSGAILGSGAANADGFAFTDAPHLSTSPTSPAGGRIRTQPTATAALPVVVPSSFTAWNATSKEFTFNNGRGAVCGSRYFVAFRVTVQQLVRWLSMDASATGRLVQATTNAAGKIVLRVPVGFGVASWAETETPLSGSRPVCRFARRETGELVLAYESGAGIMRVATVNEGGAFSVATTITAAGTFPALAVTPTGEEVFAWRTSAGAIRVRSLSAFGTALLPDTVAVASGAAEDAIAVAFQPRGGRLVWVLSYRNGSGAIISVVSENGGKTWA